VCPQVLKIERVQHARLRRRYALKRSELEDTRGKQGEQEADDTTTACQCSCSPLLSRKLL
jgi:hypothetical protein